MAVGWSPAGWNVDCTRSCGHGLHVTVPPNLDERMFAAAEVRVQATG